MVSGRLPKPKVTLATSETRLSVKRRKTEPKAKSGLIPYPKELSPEGKKIYKVLAERGADDKILALIDSPLLITYCETWAQWVEAVRQCREDGTGQIRKQVYITKSKNPAVNPAVWIANALTKSLVRMASELGCSPVGRARMAIEMMGAEEEWDTYVEKKRARLHELTTQKKKA